MNSLQHLSFCTTAMGRLDHVRQTLLRNIEENDDYPHAEFVLLDYGSNDGLGEWVKSHAWSHIERGRLAYFRLDGVKHYSHAHSKNVCFLASTGTIVCNIDADNLMPHGFAFHLNKIMCQAPRSIANYGRAPRNTKGRLAAYRSDFVRIGGYDESLEGWGWDDKDIRARLVASGCVIQWFDVQYARFIPHGDERRTENMKPEHHIKSKTSIANATRSQNNLSQRRFVANIGHRWGAAILRRNFAESFETGILQATQPTPSSLSG